jgi:metallo-beta-lactamase class B
VSLDARTKRFWLVALLGLAAPIAVVAGVLFPKWREATRRGGQTAAEPFRIAGNFYYVGASDVASFLLTGPQGHVLIDGGYPGTPPLIMASIATLGFDIRDVKVLLNSERYFDHAGGLAELQQASGAELWASDASADAIASGGDDANEPFPPIRAFISIGLTRYAAPRVDHRFRDGATIRLGPIALTAHITGGHVSGCTSWSVPVRDGDRELQVVSACSLEIPPGARLVEPDRYPGIRADFERSFRVLRSLPADIWVTSHARAFGRYRKFLERAKATNPADPFIDREGYRRYVDSAEERFRKVLADQERHPSWITGWIP